MKRIAMISTIIVAVILMLLITACSSKLKIETTKEINEKEIIYTWILWNFDYNDLKDVIIEIEENFNGDISKNEIITYSEGCYDNGIVIKFYVNIKETE